MNYLDIMVSVMQMSFFLIHLNSSSLAFPFHVGVAGMASDLLPTCDTVYCLDCIVRVSYRHLSPFDESSSSF